MGRHAQQHAVRIPLVLGLLVWFSCAWFGSWEGNPNTATRLFAAVAMAEDGTARIDRFAPLTIDKARFGDHFYLDKAPGMTLAALPAVALADAATGERAGDPARFGFPHYLRLRLRLAVAIGPALLTALAAAALFELGLALTGSAAAALAGAVGYALGTPIWGWSTTVLGHAPVGALYLIALWALWRAVLLPVRPELVEGHSAADKADGPSTRSGRTAGTAALTGLALGLAVTVEYQAVLAGAAVGALALWRWWRAPRLLLAAMAGGLVGLAPLVGYNLYAFGTPFRLGYQGVVGFDGMNQGLFGLTVPSSAALWEIMVGTRRGLLWVAPVLLFAPLGLVDLIAARRTRALGIAVAAAAAIVLLVNAAYAYWDGGNSTGPRHAMPAAALLAVGLAPFWAGARERRLPAALLVLSTAINLLIAGCDIFAAPFDPVALHWVIVKHFLPGDVTSLASDAGWPGWSGFVLWAAVAVPTLAWLTRAARLRDGAAEGTLVPAA